MNLKLIVERLEFNEKFFLDIRYRKNTNGIGSRQYPCKQNECHSSVPEDHMGFKTLKFKRRCAKIWDWIKCFIAKIMFWKLKHFVQDINLFIHALPFKWLGVRRPCKRKSMTS